MCLLCEYAFLRRNFKFLPYLVEPHEKKCGTIPEILPWILKFMSVYKLVVLNTFNGFFFTKFDPTLDIWQSKSHYFYSSRHFEAHAQEASPARTAWPSYVALRAKVAKFVLKTPILTKVSKQILTKNVNNSRIPLQRCPLLEQLSMIYT